MTWRQRIARAEKTGKFTKQDYELAADFCTCAVGEAFELKKEWKDASSNFGWSPRAMLILKRPTDEENTVDSLGMLFFRMVQNDRVVEAKAVWEKIQAAKKAMKKEEGRR